MLKVILKSSLYWWQNKY